MNEVLLGLFSGIAFGFIIQRVGATDPDKMARSHLMRDPAIPQFMLLAIALSILGLLGLVTVGAEARLSPLPTSLLATGLAGLIFGAGWGLTGYCPGTCWAAAGEGRLDAIFALLGGLAGTAAFAQVHEFVIPPVYESTSIGPVTLLRVFGDRTEAAWILAVAFFGAAALVGKYWRPHEAARNPAPGSGKDTDA